MLELLKRFEEESVADHTSLEDEDDDLVKRFGTVDLGTLFCLSFLHILSCL